MKTLKEWFDEYSSSHRDPRNQLIHKICVPLIFFSVIGFLLEVPYGLGPIRFADLFIALALGWYLTLGKKAFFVMILQVAICYGLYYALSYLVNPLWPLVIIFVLAWFGQFWGHKIEGRKPSFFKDLQFLLIGPLWVFRHFFRLM